MSPITFALRHPVTVLVATVAIVLGAVMAARRMSVDIFPHMGTPVIYCVQPYGGMDPAQMEGYLTNYTEFLFLLITGIHHVESKNIQSMALTKLTFHPGTNVEQAMAEMTNYINRARSWQPSGTTPPIVLRYDAGSVPVGYLVFSSATKSVGQVQDQATFRVRPLLSSLRGVSAPPSFGGEARTIVIRIDPERLRSYRLSPDEVIAALVSGNHISPSGLVTIGNKTHMVPINSVVSDIQDMAKIPLRTGASAPIYLRDVGEIVDGTDVEAGYALVNGRRSVFLPISKRPDASTLDVVNLVRANLPRMQADLSEDVQVSFEFDQSPFVSRAMGDVAKEGLLGALLAGLMVLLFLRDWRSVVVVVINIPLSLLAAVVALWLAGQTINVMTLGGLALAVGILVDLSTVVVENIHVRLERKTTVARAVWEGTTETAVPCLLAMLCILAVFIPSFFMEGTVRYLFVPLSLAVGFAMLASYFLSTMLVPVMAAKWLRGKPFSPAPLPGEENAATNHLTPAPLPDEGSGSADLFPQGRLNAIYVNLVGRLVAYRRSLVFAYLAISVLLIVVVGGGLGREIFPSVDAGQLQLRLRAPEGTPLASMEELTKDVLRVIAQEAGEENVEVSIALVGTPSNNYPINYIFMWNPGPHEALLRVGLRHGSGVAIEGLKERLRRVLPQAPRQQAPALKDVQLSFEAGDIVAEVMSFGSPTPLEVAVGGPSLEKNRAHAEKIRAQLERIRSLRDLQFVQSLNYPILQVDVDRERAGLSGVTTRDVARSLVAATSSSRYVVPNFWRDPNSGVGYQVQIEIPAARMNSIKEIEMVPLRATSKGQLSLRDVAQVREGTMAGEYDRYNMRRLVSLSADIHGEDLGRVARRVGEAIEAAGPPPRGMTVDVRGQTIPMQEMFQNLAVGLTLTVVVVFLLLTAYFQSLRLALAVVSPVPAAIAGAALSLFLWGTTLNIQSFMGTIMAIGVALANSILLVLFAERARQGGTEAARAAILGAVGRVRPILMTSCAMLAGMFPMALALGQGGEQTAPLARAVLGGLALATLTTLMVVPAVFALVRSRALHSVSLDPNDPQSPCYDPVVS